MVYHRGLDVEVGLVHFREFLYHVLLGPTQGRDYRCSGSAVEYPKKQT